MAGRGGLIVVAAMIAAALSGCAADTDNVIPGDPNTLTAAGPTRVIQAGDRVRVTVFGEDKLTGEFDIDPAGKLTLPLIGSIKAGGLTPDQLSSTLEDKLRAAAYRDPKATVEMLSFRPIYVLGEVQKPGDYPYRSGLTALRAIALAGGQTYRASETLIYIQHAGDPQMRSYPLNANVPIYPGDLIKLPERYF
jgi:protein involved in polysaccharide export with SLBB domain